MTATIKVASGREKRFAWWWRGWRWTPDGQFAAQPRTMMINDVMICGACRRRTLAGLLLVGDWSLEGQPGGDQGLDRGLLLQS